MIPSPQQSAVFDFVLYQRGSAFIEAVAGAGKTTTLIEACKLIAEQPRTSAVFTAFNKKIADEIGARLKAANIDWKQVQSATFHSLGFSSWRKVAPKVKVESYKMANLFRAALLPAQYESFVLAAASLAKQSCVDILWSQEDMAQWEQMITHHDLLDKLESGNVEEAVALTRRLLKASAELDHEQIDFDDMIYAPLIHGARFWQHDFVLVDEAQDTNPARRLMIRKLMKPTGRLLAVGDPHQAIYGFTGADNDALDIITREFSATRLPLTVTYRCPRTVVQFARQWVSHITAHPTAPNGSVSTLSCDEFKDLPPEAFTSSDSILCRNTAPLVETAFALIRRRIPCHIAGRDIGEGLVRLALKWKSVKTVGDLRVKICEYLDSEVEKLLKKPNNETKIAALNDKVETLYVFMDSVQDDDTPQALAAEIQKVFSDDPSMGTTLSTIHKAKGQEWDRVYWMGRMRFQPSPYARQDWQVAQEINLMYVAATRAKRELIEVEVPIPNKKK